MNISTSFTGPIKAKKHDVFTDTVNIFVGDTIITTTVDQALDLAMAVLKAVLPTKPAQDKYPLRPNYNIERNKHERNYHG